jgi:lipoate-protein ligase A
MAIDYYLAKTCHLRDNPILRFYGWEPYCLSIGCHQQRETILIKKLKADGYDFTRRPTGGRAIFHAEELTYSVHFPRKTIRQQHLYRLFHQIFADTLKHLGYQVKLKNDEQKIPVLTNKGEDYPCFTKSAQTEVQCEGKKVIGSAQKIMSNSILQHGSILIGESHKKLPAYLKLNKIEKQSLFNEMNAKSISLKELSTTPVTAGELMFSIINQLELLTNISVNWQNLQKIEIDEAKRSMDEFC